MTLDKRTVRQDAGRWMLAEIREQPEVLERLLERLGESVLDRDGILGDSKLRGVSSAIVLGSGSSLHAAMLARCYLERVAHLPTRVVGASEAFRHPEREPENVLTLAFSHSGGSADVLGAVRRARTRGFATMGITNLPNTRLGASVDSSIVTGAGVERSIPSTKGFTALGAAGLLLACHLAEGRGVEGAIRRGRGSLSTVSKALRGWLSKGRSTRKQARVLSGSRTVVFLGSGELYPVARDGALKLLEVAYLPSLSYTPEEFLHGPLAVVEPGVTLVSLGRMRRGAAERIKKRQTSVVTIGSNGADTIQLPRASELGKPFLAIAALQCLAFEVGRLLSRPIDVPRYLKKVVR